MVGLMAMRPLPKTLNKFRLKEKKNKKTRKQKQTLSTPNTGGMSSGLKQRESCLFVITQTNIRSR